MGHEQLLPEGLTGLGDTGPFAGMKNTSGAYRCIVVNSMEVLLSSEPLGRFWWKSRA
jgi:hypothetical protein